MVYLLSSSRYERATGTLGWKERERERKEVKVKALKGNSVASTEAVSQTADIEDDLRFPPGA